MLVKRDNVYIKTYNNVRLTEVDGDEMTSVCDVMLVRQLETNGEIGAGW